MSNQSHCCRLSSSLVGLVIIVSLVVCFMTSLTFVVALKHNYYTRRDERTFIGPLGYPFGFLDTGHYNLTVWDFQLSAPKHPHKHKPHKDRVLLDGTEDDDDGGAGNVNNDNPNNLPSPSELLQSVKGVGFLLKRFQDEAEFHQYMNWISANASRCVFQSYLDYYHDQDGVDQLLNDDDDHDDTSSTDDYVYLEDDDFQYFDDDLFIDGDGGGSVDDKLFPDDDWNMPNNDGDNAPDDVDNIDGDTSNIDNTDDFTTVIDDDTNRYRRRRRQLSVRRQRRIKQQHQQRQRQQQSDQQKTIVLNAAEDGIYLDMMPRSKWGHNTPSVEYNFKSGEAGLYFLMYQVCYKDNINKNMNAMLDIHTRFELDFHFSNIDIFGNESYLSAGEMVLPHLFFYFSILYGICLYVWITNIKRIKEGKPGILDTGSGPTTEQQQQLATTTPLGRGVQTPTVTVYPIHYLMGFLLSLKTLSLFFESIRYHYLRVTGHAVLWSAVYYTFAFMKGITLFTVILLIGSGWSFVKPFLSDREKKMIMAILVLQVINNIAIVVLTQETEGERTFDTFTAILHLVDILCCCAVLIPIVWQVNQLEKNMEQNQHQDDDEIENNDEVVDLFDEYDDDDDDDDDKHVPEDEFDNETPTTNGSVFHGGRRPPSTSTNNNTANRRPPDARLASKLKLFRSFYVLVVAYIYVTRIVVYLFASTLNYKHTWIRYFVVELVTFAFYVTVGMLFRPMNENPYLHIRRRKDTATRNGESHVELRKIDPSSKSVID